MQTNDPDEFTVPRRFSLSYYDGDEEEYLTLTLLSDEEPQPYWDWTPARGFEPGQSEFGRPWSKAEGAALAERCIAFWGKCKVSQGLKALDSKGGSDT